MRAVGDSRAADRERRARARLDRPPRHQQVGVVRRRAAPRNHSATIRRRRTRGVHSSYRMRPFFSPARARARLVRRFLGGDSENCTRRERIPYVWARLRFSAGLRLAAVGADRRDGGDWDVERPARRDFAGEFLERLGARRAPEQSLEEIPHGRARKPARVSGRGEKCESKYSETGQRQ